MIKFILSLFLVVPVVTMSHAQKMNLDTSAYKNWQRMTNSAISYNGDWVLYQLEYTDHLISGKEKNTKYLYNRKNAQTTILNNVSSAVFLNQGKWLKYIIPATSSQGIDSIVFLCLKNGKKTYWNRNGYFIENSTNPCIMYSYSVLNNNGSFSQRLVSWNMETGDSVIIDNIEKYSTYDNNNSVIYICKRQNKSILMKGSIWGKHVVVYSDPQKPVVDFTLHKNGETVSINAASEPGRVKDPDLLISFSLRDNTQQVLMDFDEIKIPKGYRIGNRSLAVPLGAKQVLIDVVPEQVTAHRRKDTSGIGFDLELWTWNEPVSQRKQRPGMNAATPASYPRFIYNIISKTLVQVKSEKTQSLVVPEQPSFTYIFVMDSKSYEDSLDWKYYTSFDMYLLNVRSGERRLIERNCSTYPMWSTNGKYAVWYNSKKKAWVKINPVTAVSVDISSSIGHPVYQEDYDMPNDPPPYGLAGWSKDGTGVIIYDRYDLWMVDLEGKRGAYPLSENYGRKNATRLRLLSGDYIDALDLSKNQLLRSFNEKTKGKEISILKPHKGVETLAGSNQGNFKIKELSGDGRYCIWTNSSYTKPEDLWVSDIGFTNVVQITRLNTQQQQYNWGTARLVEWNNYNGKRNQGVLYLPENYDSSKSYPLIVDFYQIYSEDMHEYINPEYSTCVINVPTYTSNGFIVFRPDIHFAIGTPAESAYNSIVSGTEALIQKGVASKNRVAIHGHSWAGYLTAYIVTRSNLFVCASPQALTVNAAADYLSVRGSGAPCMFMYEIGQSRLGKTLWDDPQMYIRNSPIFFADQIHTPLLIFHNDHDGAVDFSGGLSLFLAMRRLQKPAWLVNYKKEGHTLNGRAAQIDWTTRMRQFFDHYLNGKPMPRWMKEGINIDEKYNDKKLDY